MIKTTEELNLTVKGYRLMTLDELAKFENQMPETDCCIKWWLSDVGRILRTFKIKKNVEVTDNGKIII